MKFGEAVEIILAFEGGLSRNGRDPGGVTNFGIAKKYYPHLDIEKLTKEAAIEIYRKDFWEEIGIDRLPASLRLIVFDTSVNMGPGVAVGLLQAALGVKVDGALGPITLQKLAEQNLEKVLQAYARARLERYFNNPNFAYFGEGWVKRLTHIAIISGRLLQPEVEQWPKV